MDPVVILCMLAIELHNILHFALFQLPEELKANLEKLMRQMDTISKVLAADAQEKHFSEDLPRNAWLQNLEAVAYDASDVADELQARKQRIQDGVQKSNLFTLAPDKSFEIKMLARIKGILQRLKDIAKEKSDYNLLDHAREGSSSSRRNRETTCSDSGIMGRTEDVKKVVDWVLEKEKTEVSRETHQVVVISIWGLAGIGKTAVAQKVFHSKEVESQFQMLLWVCLGQEPNKSWLAAKILEQIKKESCVVCKDKGLDTIYHEISALIRRKRIFLVLDDVWDLDWWNDLRGALKVCAPGSRILLTTRSLYVTQKMKAKQSHHLDVLPVEWGWRFFLREIHPTGDDEEKDLDDVNDTAHEIVERCKGLPLAIQAIGREMLSKERSKKEWESVLRRKLFFCNKGSEVHKAVFPTLLMSYIHLPLHLKPCFLFCSLYPKGFMFSTADVVRLWMAEGIFQDDEDMETKGENHVEELSNSSMIQVENRDSSGRIIKFQLHDAMHDLALYVSSNRHDRCLCLESQRLEMPPLRATGKTGVASSSRLRTLVTVGSCEIPSNSFKQLEYLRILDLKGTNITKLPESVGHGLKLLTYLRVSPQTEDLPQSIRKLVCLQTLDLSGSSVTKLPEQILALRRLTHLVLDDTKKLMDLPTGIGSLTRLRTLTNFPIGGERKKSSSARITELKNMNDIRELTIRYIERIKSEEEAEESQMAEKSNLKSLNFIFTGSPEKRDDEKMLKVFQKMQPPTGLEKLSITGYLGKELPRCWFSNTQLPDLREIKLAGLLFLEQLPQLERLPSLKNIHIVGAENLRLINFCGSNTRRGGFPSLKCLTIEYMREWAEWQVEQNSMQNIYELSVQFCPSLRALPLLASLKELRIRECGELCTVPSMPSLTTLSISDCIILELPKSLPSLIRLYLTRCNSLKVLPHFRELNVLHIESCPNLVKLPRLPSLRILRINACENMRKVWKWYSVPSFLEELQLIECPKIISLPKGIHQLERVTSLTILGCPILEGKCKEERGKILHIKNKKIGIRDRCVRRTSHYKHLHA